MQWHLLWYVLAGLILGLTASTLWEWLHFRRKRMELRDRRILDLEAELRMLQQQNQELMQLAARPTPPAADYQSPAVFLENEEAESLRDDEYASQYDDTQPAVPVVEPVVVETSVVETQVVEEARYISPDITTLTPAPDAEPERYIEADGAIDGGDDTGIDEGIELVTDGDAELVSEEYRTVQSSEPPISLVADAEQAEGESDI